jgi:hypothetical protein
MQAVCFLTVALAAGAAASPSTPAAVPFPAGNAAPVAGRTISAPLPVAAGR